MNAKTLAIALALSASACGLAHAAKITTLDTVQVRPDAEQLLQQRHEAASDIPTLAAVQVRPDALLAAEQNIVTLAAVEVRPDAELYAALAAEADAERDQQRSISIAAMSAQLRQWAVMPQMQLSLGLHNALIKAAASVVTR